MSLVKTNPNDICNSPLNHSSSKMLYSFPKSIRFKTDSKILCDRFYEVPNFRINRTTGFGYGLKYDFTKQCVKTPSPNSYNIVSEFQNSKSHKKGYVIGESRDKLEITGPLACVKRSISPGPGNYPIPSTITKQKWSFRDRTKLQQFSSSKNPGPGSYEALFSLDQKGVYFSSKYKNSCASTFNPSSKSQGRSMSNPGPGTYDFQKTCLSPNGTYFVSKFQSSKVKSFSKAARRTVQLRNLSNPGPGNYQMYSEFGFMKFQRAEGQQK